MHGHEVDDVEHVTRGGPRGEGHKRRPRLDSVLAQQFEGEHRLGGRVAFVEADEDLVLRRGIRPIRPIAKAAKN